MCNHTQKMPYTKNGKTYYRKECRECYLAKLKAKRDANKESKPLLCKVYYDGMSCVPTHSHCTKCNILLDEENRYFKIMKYVNKPNKLVSSSLCKRHKLDDIREKKREYARKNPITYKPKPKPVFKPKPKPKKVITKEERIEKVNKEKVVTLKKKLHKENITPIIIEEPIIIQPSKKLTGREQAMRVFEEQKRRKERTQKEINDEKSLSFGRGICDAR